jgi:hypothetical protein
MLPFPATTGLARHTPFPERETADADLFLKS